MKKLIIAGVVILASSLVTKAAGIAGTYYMLRDTVPDVDSPENKIFANVDIEATFPGGNKGWLDFIVQNLNAAIPVDNGAKAGNYTVVVQFIVDKDGTVSDIRSLTKHGHGMEKEVVRIIAMSPKWNPAMLKGRPVKAYRKQPVTFQVVEEKRTRKKGF